MIFLLLEPQDYAIFGLNFLFFEQGFYFQPLSAMFLHAGWTHLILNMLTLLQFGLLLERFLGHLRFLLLYLVGGLLASCLSLIYVYYKAVYAHELTNTVGASGAICVLFGFYACVDKNALKGLVVALLIISFVPMLMGINIAWYAHIFGFLCGFLCAKFDLLRVKA